MEINERIAKLEVAHELHYNHFVEMYSNNREDHKIMFDKIDGNKVELVQLKKLVENHLQHREKREKQFFLILVTFLSALFFCMLGMI